MPDQLRTFAFPRRYYVFLVDSVSPGWHIPPMCLRTRITYQARQQAAFEVPCKQGMRSQQYGPRAIAEGGVIGEIDIPRLGLKVIVAQGDSPKILRRAVGHIRETPLPGEPGNVALAGHRDTFFRPLRNIRSGDLITLKTGDADFQYRVESIEVVPPSDVNVLRPSAEPSLTLITCFPFYYVGAAPNRYIVRARQVGSMQFQLAQR